MENWSKNVLFSEREIVQINFADQNVVLQTENFSSRRQNWKDLHTRSKASSSTCVQTPMGCRPLSGALDCDAFGERAQSHLKCGHTGLAISLTVPYI
jgi:hypothetical protein